MLYRSFISSQHDLIHAPEENGEERSLDNKFAMFVTLMQEAFHKFLDGEETDPEFTDDPVSEAYQIVSKALPNEFKKLAPTVDLMRYLLGEISSICFTESTGLMHIVSLHINLIFLTKLIARLILYQKGNHGVANLGSIACRSTHSRTSKD